MTPSDKNSSTKQKYSHAMLREIYEQPTAIAKTVAKHLKDDIIFPGELDAIESALLTFENGAGGYSFAQGSGEAIPLEEYDFGSYNR